MLTLRLAADDLNRILPSDPGLAVAWRDGHFVIRTVVLKRTVTAHAHPDLRDQQLRLAIPLAELEGVPRPLLAMVWDGILQRAEKEVADRLAAAGLPWDLVWIENADDPRRGRIASVGCAAGRLNAILRDRLRLGPFVPRLVGLRTEPGGITLRLQLDRL